jgi:ferric-dicitrate binding protein FerR (iron transport regulator)
MKEEKIIKYIKGEVSSEVDIVEMLNWIESSPENQKKYSILKNLWVVTALDHPGHVEIPDISQLKAHRLLFPGSLLGSLLKYAAIFVVSFGLGSLALLAFHRNEFLKLSQRYNIIEVPYGERSQLTLYDGTKVWLNSGTKIKYPVVFGGNSRNVSLEGEAYFDVANDLEHPFIVSAGRLLIEVTGTHFDVCSYPGENEISTTLEEGSVKVIDSFNDHFVNMNPGEQVILNHETNGFKRVTVNTELYTSWKENILKFDDATFEEMIKKMERWYDVKISVAPGIDTKERFTMTIKTESLREMLLLVSKTTKIKYEIKDNNVWIKRP